ncbi:MAG: YegP family protein [Kofleriaceae bacterium]
MKLTSSLLALALVASTHGLVGCVDAEDDDLLDPACDAKCDGEGATAGFEVFTGADGRYYFHLVAGNGRIVLQSQAYTTRSAAKRGAESVAINGVDPANYRLLEAQDGEWYVNLVAGNNEIIATTETYARRYNAKRAIDTSVRLVAETQRVRAAAEGGARFRVMRGADNQFYFNLRGGNGEVMLQSEGYVSPGGVAGGIESVRVNGRLPERYQVREAVDGQHYVRLVAGNGEVIARTETYASKGNADRAVERLLELIASERIADPEAVPSAPPRTMAEFPALTAGLDALADLAAKSPRQAEAVTLEYFAYAEGAAIPGGLACEEQSAAEVLEGFRDGIVAPVLAAGGATPTTLDAAAVEAMQTELAAFLADDRFEMCSEDVAGTGRAGVVLYMRSLAPRGPRVSLELGYDVPWAE